MNKPKSEIKPNFFIVGAPKAGSTSLFYYLDAHPDVFVPAIKEPNYFSYQATINQQLYYHEKGIGDWNKYLLLFESANSKKAIGEASVSYLFYPEAAQNIKKEIPNAKIIIMLRDPVERAYSHYYMDYKLGYVNCSMEDVILNKEKSKLNKLYYQQFIELGFYYEQVKRYFDLFGKENVMIILFEDFKTNTDYEVRRLYRFLAIEENINVNTTVRYNSFATPRNKIIRKIYKNKSLRILFRKIFPQKLTSVIKKIILTKTKNNLPDPSTVKYLKALYKNDMLELEKILNQNLEKWYV